MSVEFVDTNILVYAHDRSAGSRHEKAVELLICLFEDKTRAVSVQVLTEFYAAAMRKLAMTSAEAEQILA